MAASDAAGLDSLAGGDIAADSAERWREVFAPPLDLTPSEWCEKHLVLSERSTAFPGPFRLLRTPYLREIIDSFAEREVEKITFCSAAQVAKTTAIFAMLGFAIDQDPGPTLMVLPNADLCKSLAEQRLHPLIDDCPALARHKPPEAKRFRLQEIFFDRMQLALVGSNSPANLASRPIKYAFLDEVDKYPGASEVEAGSVDLVIERTKTFWNRKIVMTSTPTIDIGEIWRSFRLGSQHVYWVQCPHCGQFQPLVFSGQSILPGLYDWHNLGGVRWPDSARTGATTGVTLDGWDIAEVRRTAWYECGHCKGRITDKHKLKMLLAGEWRAEKADETRHRSFHLSALYAPWVRFGDIAANFLASRDYQDKLRNFVNSTLGEPWLENCEKVTDDELRTHCATYVLGTCPIEQPVVVFLTADLQKDHCYYVIRAWGPHDQSWLVSYGMLPTIGHLQQLSGAAFYGPGGRELRPTHAFLDSGFATEVVYRFCRSTNFVPVKGFDRLSQPIRWGDVAEMPLKLLEVDTGHWKSALHSRFKAAINAPGGWHLPQNVGNDYLLQLQAEILVEESDKWGKPVRKWKRIRPENHYLDCEVYQLAAAAAFGVRDLNAKVATPAPPAPAGGQSSGGGRRGDERKTNEALRPDGRGWWDR